MEVHSRGFNAQTSKASKPELKNYSNFRGTFMSVTQSLLAVKTGNSEDQSFLNKLNALNFGAIVFKLMHSEDGKPMTREQAEKAVKKYKMLLFLNFKYPNSHVVPNKLIDRAWHAHLLDSELYDVHCSILFNRKLHHFPYFGLRGAQDTQNFLAAAARSKALFEEYFGADVWEGDFPQPSLCCDGFYDDEVPHARADSLGESELAKAYAKLERLMNVRPMPANFDSEVVSISLG
jgi:hypothetical protein